jgi:drug/metabolite transporter superfamily protein YnfA
MTLNDAPAASPPPPPLPGEGEEFKWTVGKVFLSLFLFLAAGLAEIGGGWLVWQVSLAARLCMALTMTLTRRGKKEAKQQCPQVSLSVLPQALREHRGWWMAVLGAGILFLYGVIPTFQPMDNFGRVRVSQMISTLSFLTLSTSFAAINLKCLPNWYEMSQN